MITVGFDFGTHQTKICYETVEAGTRFYEVFSFARTNGEEALTLPSFIRICADGTLRYGYEAIANDAGGQAVTYFKQVMFSWTSNDERRIEAEQWSVLYLAFVIFLLDGHFKDTSYIVQMGMPTDANPKHYAYCKRQAIKVMASAMVLARVVFKGDLRKYLSTPCSQLMNLAKKCVSAIPQEIREARRIFPIFVFPEAYVALIPLINDHRLPTVGPNLFVDIGGGTVDISFFTNQMDARNGQRRPYLYHYYSMPYGLNMITGQNTQRSHNVRIDQRQITWQCADQFHRRMISAVDAMMAVLKQWYVAMERTNVMPFVNLCAQILDGRPICYSGGGSMFDRLKKAIANNHNGIIYNFSQVTTVSELIDHSGLHVDDGIFHILATAFALSHQSLRSRVPNEEPDTIRLVSIDKLFGEIRIPKVTVGPRDIGWQRNHHRNW